MPEEIPALRAALSLVREEMAAQNLLIKEQNEKLDDVEEKLPGFVPVRRFRWTVVAVVVFMLILTGIGWKFRAQDQARARDKEQQEVVDAERDRQNLLAGCRRANDQRAWGRRLIERAYVPVTIPDGVSTELRDLYVQGQERQAVQRAEQLADPGVQPIECEAAFPPTASKK